jgi:ribonucleoside-diphosphate reductase alpha chain
MGGFVDFQDDQRARRYRVRGVQGRLLEAYETGCKGCTTYRPNDVTGSVLSVASIAPAGETTLPPSSGFKYPGGGAGGAGAEPLSARSTGGDVIYMSEPLDRPQSLEGHTYKLKWPDSDHALYITINDIMLTGIAGPSRSSSTPRTWSISPGPWR